MALLSLQELKDRCPSESYARAFTRTENEASATTDAYAQTCLDDACNEALMRTQGYLSAQLDSQAVDPSVKRCVAAIALFNGVALAPSSGAQQASPFEPGYKRALDFLDRLASDNKARGVVSPITSTAAQAVTQNTEDASGQPTRVYGEQADRKGGSGY